MSEQHDDHDAEWQRVQQAMKVAIEGVLAGTSWAPPDGAIVTEAVVVVGWYTTESTYGSSHLRCGSPWGTRGLLLGATERVEDFERYGCDEYDDEDDE